MSNTDPVLEGLISQMGLLGKYQVRQCALITICAFLAGMNMLSLTFVAPTPAHRCFIKEIDQIIPNITSSQHSDFHSDHLWQYIPTKENGDFESCLKYDVPFQTNSTVTSCNGEYLYDKDIYATSRVYEFGMVCSGKWKRAFIQSIYVFGVLVGALVCGSLSDRLGRKTILCISAVAQFVFALTGAFIHNFALYAVTLFFYGFFGSGGAFISGFVLLMELVSKTRRSIIASAYASGFATGVCFVAIWGYLIRDVTLLQTVFALHALLLFGHYWFIDESIRWLYVQGRVEEAVEIVKKACRENGLPFNNDYSELSTTCILKSQNVDKRKYGISDLFKTRTLRFRAISTAFQWFAIALCFYGLAFNTGVLPGNPYLVFFIAGFVDIPGQVFVALTVDKTGRRFLNCTLLLIGGVACIGTTFIPKGLIVTTVIALIAKAALAGGFAVIYNYTAELFPTVVRNSAIGLCSMSARLGGSLTPQITLLDSLDHRFPTLVFGCVAICAAFMALFLPETLQKDLPQSLEDGENFGKGDTAFSTCFRNRRKPSIAMEDPEQREKLNGTVLTN